MFRGDAARLNYCTALVPHFLARSLLAKSIPSTKDFMTAVGTILTLWGRVESSHGIIFQGIASGVVSNGPLMAAYWAIVSFEGRQKMVDAALQEALARHPDYLAKWVNLNNRLIQKNRVRNKIAHGSVIRLAGSDGEQIPTFVPFFHSKIAENFGPKGKLKNNLSLTDLDVIANSILVLSGELQDFWQNYVDEQIFPKATELPDGSTALPMFDYPFSKNADAVRSKR